MSVPVFLTPLTDYSKVSPAVVDFGQVMKNAAAEGIPLDEIMIQYDGLTPNELAFLKKHQEVTYEMGDEGRVIAKFPTKGFPLYQEKATSVLHLGA